MSLSGDTNTALDSAVANSIASGVTYALAAGNDSADACGVSPARVPDAITVGATTSERRAIVILQRRHLRGRVRARLGDHLGLVLLGHRDEHPQRHLHGITTRRRCRRAGAVHPPDIQPDTGPRPTGGGRDDRRPQGCRRRLAEPAAVREQRPHRPAAQHVPTARRHRRRPPSHRRPPAHRSGAQPMPTWPPYGWPTETPAPVRTGTLPAQR